MTTIPTDGNNPTAEADVTISPAAALGDLEPDDPSKRRLIEYDFETAFSQTRVIAEREFIKLTALDDHFRHKKYWSFLLMFLMLFMVAFQALLIFKVGKGKWDYKGYDWLLPTLMIQYLAQIVGLAIFVVKSLFKEVS